MRSFRRITLAGAIALACLTPAFSQSAPKILRVNPFTGEGLSSSESSAIQSLVTSYISEYKIFRLIDAEAQERALKEAESAIQLGNAKDLAPLTADYILSANGQSAGGLVVFTMDLTRVSTGEKRNVAKSTPTVNDLIMSLRGLTDSLFDRVQPAAGQSTAGQQASGQSAAGQSATGQAAASAPLADSGVAVPVFLQEPSLVLIAGTWSGDKGIDRITLFKDGRGAAVLSSGTSMKVRAKVSGASIIIVQDQPSIADFYKSSGIDLKMARAIASQARPWRWIFSLTADKSSLIGTKESVFVKMDKGALAVDNGYVREARWNRLFQ